MVEHEFNELRQTIHYQDQLLPYTLNTIHTRNGHPDILFHWHPECEFIYVEEGSARFHIDSSIFYSQPGDIILINPNALHSIHPIDQQTHTFKTLNFHLDLIGLPVADYSGIRYLQTLQNGLTGFKALLRADDENYQALKDTLTAIFSCVEAKKPFHSFYLKAKLNEFFYLLYLSGHTAPKPRHQDAYRREEKIRRVIQYIQKNHARPLPIEELATVCNYSPTHFMSFFKTNVGVTAIEFLIQYRLKMAIELLEHSTKSVIDIATECGFNNLSNFNRQFKKHYHMSPRQHRQHFIAKEKTST